MGVLDGIILALLAVGVFFAVRSLRRGAGGCSGNCAGCGRAGDQCPGQAGGEESASQEDEGAPFG